MITLGSGRYTEVTVVCKLLHTKSHSRPRFSREGESRRDNRFEAMKRNWFYGTTACTGVDLPLSWPAEFTDVAE
jgi:hypothetical protein